MAEPELRENDHNIYWCVGHGEVFEGRPIHGYWLDLDNCGAHHFDDNNNPFFEGDKKILKLQEAYSCHSEDNPCYYNAGNEEMGFINVVCEMWVCVTCGTEYTFDNEYCSDHAYSLSEDAELDARNCCSVSTEPKSTSPSSEEIDYELMGQLARHSAKSLTEAGKTATAVAKAVEAVRAVQAVPEPHLSISRSTSSSSITGVTYSVDSYSTGTMSVNMANGSTYSITGQLTITGES